jgi:hypothetical protein
MRAVGGAEGTETDGAAAEIGGAGAAGFCGAAGATARGGALTGGGLGGDVDGLIAGAAGFAS